MATAYTHPCGPRPLPVRVLLLAWTLLLAAGCPGMPRLEGETVRVDGLTRSYLLHVPRGYTAGEPRPLVIALHGFGGSGRIAARSFGFGPVADREGFFVAYPDGLNRLWRYREQEQNAPPFVRPGVDDVAFLDALIDDVARRYAIDANRVYATGFSNGGFMSFRLGCSLSERIAAIAPVCANLSEGQAEDCAPGRPVPLLLICGTDDPFIPYRGGTTEAGPGRELRLLSAEDTAAFWAQRNGCDSEPLRTLLPENADDDGTRVEQIAHQGCPAAPVTLLAIEGGGHTWPGGTSLLPESFVGRSSRELNGAETVWAFLSEHALDEAGR